MVRLGALYGTVNGYQLTLEWAMLSKYTRNDTYRALADRAARHIATMVSVPVRPTYVTSEVIHACRAHLCLGFPLRESTLQLVPRLAATW